jgi:quercetin dioxygenase-like cupin family protein
VKISDRAASIRTLAQRQAVNYHRAKPRSIREFTMAHDSAADTVSARTPGAKRAGPGEYLFNLANLNHILGGPDYSTANGACVEGDRMIVGLMRMPAGTGAAAHSHPNEQWIYILEGTFHATVGDKTIEAKPGSVVYVPADVVHAAKAGAAGDVVFFTVKDASHSLHGIKA